MDEEQQGNLDSFVDIVANTAGIMIVLVVMSLLDSNKAGVELNTDLKDLTSKRENIAVLQKDTLPKKKKELGRARAALEQGLRELNVTRKEAAALPESVDKAKEDETARLRRLDQVATEEQQALRAREAARQKAEGITQEEMDLLRDRKIDEMRTELGNLQRETGRLKQGALDLVGEKAKLEERIAGLTNEVAVLAAQVGAQGGETLDVAGSVTGLARVRVPVWFECFMPETPKSGDDALRARVRLVSQATYVEEGEKDKRSLRPQKEGETTFEILQAGSAFREYVAKQPKVIDIKGKQKDLYLMFVIRPDAYRVFRLARKLAREEGWQVDWRPIEAAVPRKTTGAASPAARLDRARRGPPPVTLQGTPSRTTDIRMNGGGAGKEAGS